MMTIADIYDALSAADRPYKKAVPSELALDTFSEETKEERISGALLNLFRDAEIFRVTSTGKPS